MIFPWRLLPSGTNPLGIYKEKEGANMRTELNKIYENEKPIGLKYARPDLGILVFEPLEKEAKYDCVACYTDGKDKWGFTKHKLYFNGKDSFYIVKGHHRWHIEDALLYDEM